MFCYQPPMVTRDNGEVHLLPHWAKEAAGLWEKWSQNKSVIPYKCSTQTAGDVKKSTRTIRLTGGSLVVWRLHTPRHTCAYRAWEKRMNRRLLSQLGSMGCVQRAEVSGCATFLNSFAGVCSRLGLQGALFIGADTPGATENLNCSTASRSHGDASTPNTDISEREIKVPWHGMLTPLSTFERQPWCIHTQTRTRSEIKIPCEWTGLSNGLARPNGFPGGVKLNLQHLHRMSKHNSARTQQGDLSS